MTSSLCMCTGLRGRESKQAHVHTHVSSYKDTNPATPPLRSHLTQLPPYKPYQIVTLGIKASTYKLWGCTIQSISLVNEN